MRTFFKKIKVLQYNSILVAKDCGFLNGCWLDGNCWLNGHFSAQVISRQVIYNHIWFV